jgi:multicomponent Na+:H+ antiporter subunit F
MMQTFFLFIALAILFSAFLALYRLLRGPGIVDRIVAVNVIGTKTVAVILLTGYLFERIEFFIDIAFVYAIINFIGTLTLSKYFERKSSTHRSIVK